MILNLCLLVSNDDRKSSLLPIGNPFFQASCLISVYVQNGDRFVGKDTIGTTTVGNNFSMMRELCQTCFQFGDRNGMCVWEMSGLVLLARTHIKQKNPFSLQTFAQLFDRNECQLRTILKEGTHQSVYFSQMLFSHLA